MKKVLICLLLSWFCITAKTQNSYFKIYLDSAALKNQNDELIRDIETRVKLVESSFSLRTYYKNSLSVTKT